MGKQKFTLSPVVAYNNSQPWSERYYPNQKDDLVVHKKKLDHITAMLSKSCGMRILLLTGPSGCGKTAALKCMARTLRFEILEWTCSSTGQFDAIDGTCIAHGLTQAQLFADFLRGSQRSVLRQNRVDSGSITTRRLILVKDIPNVFVREPEQFAAVLLDYVKYGRCLLAFVLPDGATRAGGGGGCVRWQQLFPERLLRQLPMDHVELNSVAATFAKQALQRVACLAGLGRLLSPSCLQRIVDASNGDLRAAINTLQFELEGATVSKQLRQPGLQTRLDNAKDEQVSLFRALGRILHNKRCDKAPCEEPSVLLPGHMAPLARRRSLGFSPETLVERSGIDCSMFALFVQQNYVDFLSDLEAVCTASSYHSDAAVLLDVWQDGDSRQSQSLQEIGASVAVRGLLFAHPVTSSTSSPSIAYTTKLRQPSVSSKFRPITKPIWLGAWKRFSQAVDHNKDVLLPVLWCTESTYTFCDVAPMLAKLRSYVAKRPGITPSVDGDLQARLRSTLSALTTGLEKTTVFGRFSECSKPRVAGDDLPSDVSDVDDSDGDSTTRASRANFVGKSHLNDVESVASVPRCTDEAAIAFISDPVIELYEDD